MHKVIRKNGKCTFPISLPVLDYEILMALADVQRVGESKHSNVHVPTICAEQIGNYLHDAIGPVFGISYADFYAKRRKRMRVPLRSRFECPPDTQFANLAFYLPERGLFGPALRAVN